MATDQNKKTLRSFQCRDYLWEIFEQMSQELECSVDYLINESMRQYARSRNFGRTSQPGLAAPRPSQPPSSAPSPRVASSPGIEARVTPAPPPPSYRPPAAEPATLPPPARTSEPPPRPRASLPPGALDSDPPPPLPTAAAPVAPPPLAPPPLRPSVSAAPPLAPPPLAPPQAQRASAPALPPAPPPLRSPSALPPLPPKPPTPSQAPQVAARPSLYVIFNGQKFPVSKDEFVIGRGSKSADLAIKDGNISRRHAAVVFHGGAYYMKDLGSTNGIDFAGQKVGTKRIDEGDLFQICDYELRFTFQ